MIDLFEVLPNLRMTDFVDVTLVAAVLYLFLLALKQTRTTFVVVGAVLVTGVYVTAIAFDLRLSRYLIQLIVAVAFLALVVMFHEELRASAERLLSWRFQSRRHGQTEDSVTSGIVDTLIGTVTDFARERIGAIIVLPGRDNLSRFVRAGDQLDGVLSEALLKSIFDAHSIGHDGAVVLAGNRIERFGCHLPLSSDSQKLGKRGTRHAAALGLAEKTDSLCLVVSEERGTISIAHHAQLEQIDDMGRLSDILGAFYREMSPAQPRRSWTVGLSRNLGLKAVAVICAIVLWFLIVHEGTTEYRGFMVDPTPVGQDALTVSLVEPAGVQVVVSGPRRRFYWVDETDLKVNLPLVNRAPGAQDIFLTATNVELPEGMTFVNLVPRTVRVTLSE